MESWSVLFASFFFGFMKTLGQLALINDTLKSLEIPMEFYNALPYVMTLVALMIFSRNIVDQKSWVSHTIKENVKRKDSLNCLFLIKSGRKSSSIAYPVVFAYNKDRTSCLCTIL